MFVLNTIRASFISAAYPAVIRTKAPVHNDLLNLAQIRTFFAFKRGKFVCSIFEMKPGKPRLVVRYAPLFPCGQGRSDRSVDIVMFGHGYIKAEYVLKGGPHALIPGDSAEEHDMFADLLASHDLFKIIVRNRIRKTRGKIHPGVSHLLMMDQVGLHENRAPGPKVRRGRGFKGKSAEIVLDRHL